MKPELAKKYNAMDRVVLRIALLCLHHAPKEMYEDLVKILPEDELIALLHIFNIEEATPQELLQRIWQHDWRSLLEERKQMFYEEDLFAILKIP